MIEVLEHENYIWLEFVHLPSTGGHAAGISIIVAFGEHHDSVISSSDGGSVAA